MPSCFLFGMGSGYTFDMDETEKEQIRTRTDLVELISSYTALKKMGDKFKGLCPFHQEKTPSFNVDPTRGRWHCFGACNVGGDAFSFLMRAENLTFPEAAKRLAERAGIVLSSNGADVEEVRRVQSEKERIYEVNAFAARFFRDAFNRARLAQEYATGRGLVYETREAFQIGYAPDDWTQLADFLLRQKIHPEDAVKAGLILPSRRGDGTYTDRFRGRLIFPIVDVQERVVGFGGRLIVPNPDAPKYLNSPETPVFQKKQTLYGLNRGRRVIGERKTAVVVEGYMDAVVAHQAGIAFVVATLGTALTNEHVQLLRRYIGENGSVLLSFDADAAGVRAALKAADLIAASASDVTLRVLALPPGEDPDSLITGGNAPAFHRAIDNALTVPEFRLRSLQNQTQAQTEQERFALLRDVIAIIADVGSPLERERLVRTIVHLHPTFAQNSLRAEELIRAEVAQARQGTNKPDSLDSTNTLPPPTRRGGPTGYGGNADGYRNGYNNGANGGYNSGTGAIRRNNFDRRRNVPFVRPDDVPLPPPRSAGEEAERTLLCACLSDEWLPVLRRVTHDRMPPAYLNGYIRALLDTLWPLVTGHIRPTEALANLSEELADFADAILMAEGGSELSEQVIRDALQTVILGQVESRARQNAQNPMEMSDAQLKAWQEQKRLNPRRSQSQNSDDEATT